MGRKRKIVDPEGLSKTTLPPCRVCGAPAAGFHYGANTCEACKGFFHRSLKLHTQYKCESSGDCVIEHGLQKLCQYCRYEKCLSVGMAKSAIKTGRYTSVKRTNDILEIKKLQDQQYNPSGNGGLSPHSFIKSESGYENSGSPGSHSGNASHGWVNYSGQEAVGTNNQNKSPSYAFSPSHRLSPYDKKSTDSGNQEKTDHRDSSQATTSVSSPHRLESLFTGSPKDCPSHHSYLQQVMLSPMSASPASHSSSYGSPLDYNPASSSPSVLTELASSLLSFSATPSPRPGPSPSSSSSIPGAASSSMSCSYSVTSPSSSLEPCRPSLTSLVSSAPSPSPSLTSGPSSSSLTTMDESLQGSMSSLCQSCRCSVDHRSIAEMFEDKDAIINLLVEANKEHVESELDTMTEEEMRRQQLEHYEYCKIQKEMFGELPRLPDSEYDYIFVTTGLDMDDRQKRLDNLGAGLEKMIRGMVKFSKVIPGFELLDIVHKVSLIKYSRQDFCMFVFFKFMNCELKVMRGMDNQWKCEHELAKVLPNFENMSDLLAGYFRFCQSLQSLKLTEEELVIIRAIIIMSPDRNPPVRSPIADEIHWHLSECLIYQLSQRVPNPLFYFAKITDRMTEARSQTESVLRFLRSLKVEKYSKVLDNPLLREMCAGLFFDDKDEHLDYVS